MQRRAMITAAASLGFAVVQLDGSILTVALPTISRALGAGVDVLQWTVDAYLLVFAALLLSAGALADRIGAKRAFIAGFEAFAAASLACGMAPSSGILIVARALQGVGGALLVPCSLALINNACGGDAATRARAIGIWTAAGGVALAAGPVVSGLLLTTLGWRSVFLANLPLGALGIWMAARFATETEPATVRRGLDPLIQILAATLLTAIVWTVIERGSMPGLIVTAAASIGLILIERKAKDPAIPFGFFRDMTFSIATIGGFVVSVLLLGLAFATSLYFQTVLHYTPAETGLALVPFAVGITVSNLAGGWLSSKAGARLPIAGGLMLGAAGFAMLAGVGANATYLSMLPAQIICRFGCAPAVPAMTAALLATVPRAQSGSASGLLNAIRQAGAAIGVALFGALVRGNMIEGLRAASIIAVVLLAIAGIAAAVLIRPAHRSNHAPLGSANARAN